MEEAKKKLREIFAGYDYDIPEEVKLNLIKEWQKDLDKIKELEAKILSLECDNNELQEEANYYRNESLVEKAEKKKLAKKAFNAGVKYGNYHSLDEELSELLSNETFNFEDWYNKEVQ